MGQNFTFFLRGSLSMCVFASCFLSTGCTESVVAKGPAPQSTAQVAPIRTQPIQVGQGRSYCVKGKRYYIQNHCTLVQEGIASHYGDRDGCHGGPTACGERFDKNSMTAAHKTLPLFCFIRVDNLENGRSLVLRVKDRGPFRKGRIVDVSSGAAKRLGFHNKGLARVRVTSLGKNPPEAWLVDAGKGKKHAALSKKTVLKIKKKGLNVAAKHATS